MLPSNALKDSKAFTNCKDKKIKTPLLCGGVDNGGASLPGHGHHGPDRAVESNLDPGHQMGEQAGRQLQVLDRQFQSELCLINLIN